MTNTGTITISDSDRALLGRNKLFRDIRLESVEPALKDCQIITLKSGATLLEVGQKNFSFYLVLEGELRVYLNGRGLPVHAVLGPGECVGELSLVDGENTAALVIAAQDTRLLVMPHDLVWSLVESLNGVARNLLSILAGRIRSDNLLQVTTPESSLEFEAAANVDLLTGLHNKNWMNEAFHRMALRCERNGIPLFLLVADIDHFKDFVGRHGHLAGDNILKGVSRIMAINLRPHDLLAHMGGDKFAVLMPEQSQDLAMKTADRLRAAIAAPALRIGAGRVAQPGNAAPAAQEEHILVSLGVSMVKPGDTLTSALANADEALRQAKADGRNRVRMAAPIEAVLDRNDT